MNQVKRAVVVLSGGQDSTTCLYWALREFPAVHAMSFSYGQRHASELEAAEQIAVRAGVPWRKFDLGVLGELGDSALVGVGEIAGAGGRPDHAMPGGLPTSFVPGRNAIFLTAAAALAVKLGARDIVTGVCQTDYSGYPDCRREFVDALEKSLTLAMPSSAGPLVIHTPLMTMTKAETVHLARSLPGCWESLALTVTCYHGQRSGCGACPACELRARGFSEAGEVDPSCAST